MKHFLTFLLALIFSCTGFAQGRDAEILQLQKDYRLNDDGSIAVHVRTSHRYNTHLGFDQLGEHFVIYNPRHQQLKIAEAYTVQKNGNIVKSPANAFNEVLPAFATDAVAYNHLREKVISFTGVELEAVSHLAYTLSSDAGYYPELDVSELLLQDFPVKEYVITVDIPEGKKLSHGLYNITAKPDVTTKAGRTVYTWRFKDLPEVSREANQSKDNQPRLIFSTWKSQQDAMRWLADKMQGGKSETLDKKIQVVLDKQDNPHKMIMEVYAEFLGCMGESKVPAAYSGYRFRDAETIVQSAYGTEADRALVLAQALRKFSKETTPVAVYPKWFDGTVGSLSCIDSFAVNMPAHDEALCLSPQTFSTSSLLISQPGKNYFSIGSDSTGPIKRGAVKNSAAVRAKLTFAEKEINAVSETSVRGAFNPTLEIIKDVEGAKKLLTGKVNDAKLTGLSKPSSIQAVLTSVIPVKENGGYFVAELPSIQGGVTTWDLTKLGAKRQTSVALPYPVTENYTFTLAVPKGKRVSNPDVQISKKNNVGSVQISFETKADEVKIIRRLELKKSEITPAEYSEFLELIHPWLDKNYRTLILADVPEKK